MPGVLHKSTIKRKRLLIVLITGVFILGTVRDAKNLTAGPAVDDEHVVNKHSSIQTPDSTEEPLRIYTNSTGGRVACVVPNACISNSGGMGEILHVPDRLGIHAKLLRACVRPNLRMEYYQTGSIGPNLHLKEVDVLGMPFVDPFYKHFAHLGPRLIAFGLLPASLFLASEPSIVPHCVSPSGELQSCHDRWDRPNNPRIVVGDHVIHNRKGVWNRDFAQMISGNFSHLHAQKFENEEKIPTMCFRSAIMSPLNYDGSVELHDRMLREKGVERSLQLLGPYSDICKPHVVVLLRNPGRKQDRTFSEETRAKLSKTLDEHLMRANYEASVEIIDDLGSGRGQLEQMEVFQRADILASAHGAELTNALFLRNNARLIELSPFGLYDGWFHNTIRAASAHETKICAPPDRERFKACVKDGIIKRGEDKNTLNSSPPMKEFDELAEFYQWLAPHQTCQFKEKESRRCVRQQRMLIDAQQLSTLILDEVRTLCDGAEGNKNSDLKSIY